MSRPRRNRIAAFKAKVMAAKVPLYPKANSAHNG